MKKTQLLFLFLISTLTAIAQSGNIKGKVQTSDGQAAPSVTVSLKGLTKGATTDASGNYELKKVTPGDYTLVVSFIGLESKEVSVTVQANETTNLPAIILKEDSKQLDEVVVVGSKKTYKVDQPSQSLRLQTPLIETPQNIQVITEKVLADQQVISMSDGVIRNVSGATRLEHWGDMYTLINVRGGRASAFRNGMNITSSWGPLTEDMSFVDHVEFVKGPAGFMMSNGDPTGIYNVVTKKPTGRDFNGAASFTLGSFDLYRGTLDLDGKLEKTGKLLFRLNLMGQTKNSFRVYEFNNRYSIAPVISYKIDDNTTLTAEYTLQHVSMSNIGSAYVFSTQGYGGTPVELSLNDPGLDPTKINDHSFTLNLQHKINDNWKLTAQGAYFNYQQIGSSLWPAALPNAVNSDGTVLRQVNIADASNIAKFGQIFVNGDVTTGIIRHRILGGLDLGTKEYLGDWWQSHVLDSAVTNKYFNIYKPVYGSPANGYPTFDRSKGIRERAGLGATISQRYTGLYFQDELGFWENRIRLTLAGRYTYVKDISYGTSVDGEKFTPRIGLSGSINPETSVYALYDQSFLPQTGLIRSGKQPKPITGNNVEFGLKRDWFNGKWNTTIAAYKIIKNNGLTPDPSNVTGSTQYSIETGQTQTKGIELDIRGELARGLSLVANYAYTDSKITKSNDTLVVGNREGDVVPGFAKHNANAWLSYKVPTGALKGVGISGGFSYQTNRTTWSWGGPGEKSLPDYFRLDGGMFWEKDKIRITANVFNILNTYLYSGSYYAYGGYYYWQTEAPRNLRVSLNYTF
ncbi:TonB-dependent receptor [Cytophagaceae bacterium YF14B1]|uniref:TonB-dependent receptor n=1 Tax=Xanthocytophaga flava TaxID=3048013 RepID=A0AAE3U912_9BACT|nr:TonB-dependent receptor [Xanthocytophaga flavus]MDJ1484036.1 TonB-dependent receptor [Xanthocytophaga flavus]